MIGSGEAIKVGEALTVSVVFEEEEQPPSVRVSVKVYVPDVAPVKVGIGSVGSLSPVVGDHTYEMPTPVVLLALPKTIGTFKHTEASLPETGAGTMGVTRTVS